VAGYVSQTTLPITSVMSRGDYRGIVFALAGHYNLIAREITRKIKKPRASWGEDTGANG